MIREKVAEGEPDFATPGARADNFAEIQAADAFAEGFPVRGGVLVAKNDDVAAKRVLHVPDGIPDARLPVKPGLAEKFGENPGIDIAAVVVADIDDQALAVKHGIKITGPFGDVF